MVPSGNIVDVEIKRTDEFRRIIEHNQDIIEIPNQIKKFSIDFSNTRTYTNIIKKIRREYHSADTMLIIVLTGRGPTNSYVEQFSRKLSFSSHDFKDNIRFFTADQFFFEFLGMDKILDGFYYTKYEELQDLIYKCYTSKFSDKDIDKLSSLSNELRDLLGNTGQIPLDNFLR